MASLTGGSTAAGVGGSRARRGRQRETNTCNVAVCAVVEAYSSSGASSMRSS